MPNKHRMKGKFNEVVGNMTDDKAKKYKGIAQNKLGEMKDKASHMTDTDMDEKSIFSIAIGVVLILSGLYFVMRAKDDLF
ncbi:CsbD family protein [Carnobacteriaceae bacterium 52-44]